MKILVIGGTGTVGRQVVRDLKSAGLEPRIMTSAPNKADKLRGYNDVVVANLRMPESLRKAFSGVNAVFLCVSQSQDETQQGLNAIQAAKEEGVDKIVYLSIYNADKCEHIPFFNSKKWIEQNIKGSGIPYVILRPNSFFQNDLWQIETIRIYNSYPIPLGSKGVSRVDVRDISDAAVNAFTSNKFNYGTYSINGPEKLTGSDCAATLSKYGGYEVKYAGDDLNVWADIARHTLPDWMVDDVAKMYKHFQENGFYCTDEEMEQQMEIVGHNPKTYDSFVSEIDYMLLE